MSRLAWVFSAVALGACLAVAGLSAAPAWAQESTDPVSGRGSGPGVTVDTPVTLPGSGSATTTGGSAATAAAGESGPTAVLGEQAQSAEQAPTAVLGEQAQRPPIILPRTGGPGTASLAATAIPGLLFAAT